MPKVMVIGARGAIGRVLCRELGTAGCEVVRVTRQGGQDSLSFQDALRTSPRDYGLIVDASTSSLNDYLRLVDWLADKGPACFVHFSSVRATTDDERDAYAAYKRSVLAILEPVAQPAFQIVGDLFAEGKRLVGYWHFVRNADAWTILSPREVGYAVLKDIAGQFAQIARGSVPAASPVSGGLPVLDVAMHACSGKRISQSAASQLTRLRMNLLLRPLKVCIVQ